MINRFFKKYRLYIIAVLAFLILEAGAVSSIVASSVQREEYFLDQKTNLLSTGYYLIQNEFRISSEIFFHEILNRPEVLTLLAKANQADEKTQSQLRTELFTQLNSEYLFYKEKDLSFLQFSFPDSTSFLRFHKPERFGDKLNQYLPLVNTTNQTLQPAFAFEFGRTFSGFRYAFPILHEGQHIATVEFGYSFQAIQERLQPTNPSKFLLLINRENVESKVFPEELVNYYPSALSEKYLQQYYPASRRTEVQDSNISDQTLTEVSNRLASEFNESITSQNSFSLVTQLNNNYYTLTAFPIQGIDGNTDAYLISVSEDNSLHEYQEVFLISLISSSATFILVLFLVLIQIRNAQIVQQNRDRLQKITDRITSGLFVLDRNEIIRFANPSSAKITGYSQSELIGKHLMEICLIRLPDGTSLPYEEWPVPPILKKGKEFSTELIGYFKDPTIPVFMEVHGEPLYDSESITGALIIFTDITERQKTQQALLAAKEAAESAARVKSEFLATMSHEIRTPMNGVIGMTSLLLDTNLTSEQLEYVETIRISGDSLLTIINDILDFSKIDSGKMALEFFPFRVNDCIEEAIDLLSQKAMQKKLGLFYLIEPDVPEYVVSDITRLRQVLVNLISNAVKFTEEGEIFIHVRRELDSPDSLLFTVRDTGIGISSEKQSKLFTPFSQADSSTTRRYGGTGLGLAISARLVNLLGGRIWLESEPGRGTIFHFTVHVEKARQITDKNLDQLTKNIKNRRVLIVDDNPTNCRILHHLASKWKMIPKIATSAQQALDMITAGQMFDLAIIDMQMPDMDGMTLARNLNQRFGKYKLPLILLSSMGAFDSSPTIPQELFAAYISKPVKQSRLLDTILQILADKEPAKEKKTNAKQLDPDLARYIPLKILVAEDNPVNQKLILRVLEKMGYLADMTANGLEVIEALKRQSYDLIFMDVQMPEMDGLEAAQRIVKEFDPTRRPVIVAMTANVMQGDRERCLKAGMDDYIAKPVQIHAIQNVIQKWGVPLPQPEVVSGLLPVNLDVVLDKKITNGFKDMGAIFVKEMILAFEEETQQTFEVIQSAVKQANAQQVSRAAHSLHGASLNMGAAILAQAAFAVEQKAQTGDLQGIFTLLDHLQSRLDLTIKALGIFCDSIE